MREFCRGVKGILFSKLLPIVKALVLILFIHLYIKAKSPDASGDFLLYENLPVNCPTQLTYLKLSFSIWHFRSTSILVYAYFIGRTGRGNTGIINMVAPCISIALELATNSQYSF